MKGLPFYNETLDLHLMALLEKKNWLFFILILGRKKNLKKIRELSKDLEIFLLPNSWQEIQNLTIGFCNYCATILVIKFAKHVQITYAHVTTKWNNVPIYLNPPTYFTLYRLGYLPPYLPLLCKWIIYGHVTPKFSLSLGSLLGT